MFLTRLTLEPTAYRAARLLRDTQQLHAAIAASFPDGPGGRLLWRIEPVDRSGQIQILVASPGGPTESELWERITTPDRAQTRPYGPLLDRLAKGDRYRFRTTLNPVRTHNGKHTPIFDRSAQTVWVATKLGANGVSLNAHSPDLDADEPDVQITATSSDRFTRAGSPGTIELLKVTFDGSLTVTDPEKLRHALCNGIGRAKGYGCGMLTLAPAT
ncbi:casE_Cse3, CRISPR-associated protein Cas6/Cse3/CasE, subtype I-E/ECOLI [Mycobacteriaceae bacterium]